MKRLGAVIRAARLEQGLTQAQLADICGLKRVVISKYESGAIDPPFSNVALIAEKLEINLGVLSARQEIRCPKCGEVCGVIYRSNRYADIVGCDNCVYELDAVADADANPEEYGLEETL